MAGCAKCGLKNGLSVLPLFSWWYLGQWKNEVVKPRNLCLYLYIRGLGNRSGLPSPFQTLGSIPASSQAVPSWVPQAWSSLSSWECLKAVEQVQPGKGSPEQGSLGTGCAGRTRNNKHWSQHQGGRWSQPQVLRHQQGWHQAQQMREKGNTELVPFCLDWANAAQRP